MNPNKAYHQVLEDYELDVFTCHQGSDLSCCQAVARIINLTQYLLGDCISIIALPGGYVNNAAEFVIF